VTGIIDALLPGGQFCGEKAIAMRIRLISGLLFFASIAAFAQQPAQHEGPWRVAAIIGHTLIPARHSAERVLIPSWGLDLEYWFHERWGFGLHSDIEIESFLIQRGAEELVERQYPLIITADLLWKPWKGLVFQFGPGIELEQSEDLWVIRTGVEYEIELGQHWDLAPVFFYDTRLEAYDSWTLGLGVGYRF
jgi:hypothetical protein